MEMGGGGRSQKSIELYRSIAEFLFNVVIVSNPLPVDKILDWSKLKQMADNI